jgi:PAS domain S-box-containing protein
MKAPLRALGAARAAVQAFVAPRALPAEFQVLVEADDHRIAEGTGTMRVVAGVLGILALGAMWGVNAPALSLSALALGVAYTLWAAWALTRARNRRAVSPWLLAALDMSVVSGTNALALFNPSGAYEALLAPAYPLISVCWIAIIALHRAAGPCLLAGALAAGYRASILGFVVGTGQVAITEASLYGVPAVNLPDQWMIVALLGLAGAFAAWLAAANRTLLVSAARHRGERDHLARSQAQARVRLASAESSERLFRSTFERAPWGMTLLTPDHVVLRVNRSFAETLGWTAEALEGLNLRQLLAQSSLPTADTTADLFLRRRDGTRIAMRASMGVALDEAGAPMHVTAQFVPVPEADPSSTRIPHLAPPRADERAEAPLARCTVLLVDDDADLLAWMVTVLRREGASVRTATLAEHALERLAELEPDLVVADARLPDGDGRAVLERARVLARPPRLALMSGGERPPNLPADVEWLAKPFRTETIAALLRPEVSRAEAPLETRAASR